MEERTAVRIDEDFARALAGTIWIVPPHRVALAVAPDLLLVFIALVAGDDQDRARPRSSADRIQQARGPHDIDIERLARRRIAVTYQRLCRKMKDEVRPRT